LRVLGAHIPEDSAFCSLDIDRCKATLKPGFVNLLIETKSPAMTVKHPTSQHAEPIRMLGTLHPISRKGTALLLTTAAKMYTKEVASGPKLCLEEMIHESVRANAIAENHFNPIGIWRNSECHHTCNGTNHCCLDGITHIRRPVVHCHFNQASQCQLPELGQDLFPRLDVAIDHPRRSHHPSFASFPRLLRRCLDIVITS